MGKRKKKSRSRRLHRKPPSMYITSRGRRNTVSRRKTSKVTRKARTKKTKGQLRNERMRPRKRQIAGSGKYPGDQTTHLIRYGRIPDIREQVYSPVWSKILHDDRTMQVDISKQIRMINDIISPGRAHRAKEAAGRSVEAMRSTSAKVLKIARSRVGAAKPAVKPEEAEAPASGEGKASGAGDPMARNIWRVVLDDHSPVPKLVFTFVGGDYEKSNYLLAYETRHAEVITRLEELLVSGGQQLHKMEDRAAEARKNRYPIFATYQDAAMHLESKLLFYATLLTGIENAHATPGEGNSRLADLLEEPSREGELLSRIPTVRKLLEKVQSPIKQSSAHDAAAPRGDARHTTVQGNAADGTLAGIRHGRIEFDLDKYATFTSGNTTHIMHRKGISPECVTTSLPREMSAKLEEYEKERYRIELELAIKAGHNAENQSIRAYRKKEAEKEARRGERPAASAATSPVQEKAGPEPAKAGPEVPAKAEPAGAEVPVSAPEPEEPVSAPESEGTVGTVGAEAGTEAVLSRTDPAAILFAKAGLGEGLGLSMPPRIITETEVSQKPARKIKTRVAELS